MGGVHAAAGGGPAHDARFGLFQPPSGGLLDPVMMTARGTEIAFVGRAFGPGLSVVEVVVLSASAAARRWARRRTGAHQVGELSRRGVPLLVMAMLAGSLGDGLERDVQAA